MIHFYFMNGCPHCAAAQKALSSEIASGQVILKSTSEVPKGLDIKGFPHFINISNGLSHVGWPGSKEKLFLALKFSSGQGTGRGSGTDIGIGHGTGMGRGTGTGHGTGHGTGMGRGTGTGHGTGMGRGTGMGPGTGTGHGTGMGRGTGTGHGTGMGRGTGMGPGTGMGRGTGIGSGQNKPPFIFDGDVCKSRGGYVTLNQTWGNQSSYTA